LHPFDKVLGEIRMYQDVRHRSWDDMGHK